ADWRKLYWRKFAASGNGCPPRRKREMQHNPTPKYPTMYLNRVGTILEDVVTIVWNIVSAYFARLRVDPKTIFIVVETFVLQCHAGNDASRKALRLAQTKEVESRPWVSEKVALISFPKILGGISLPAIRPFAHVPRHFEVT